VYSSGSNIFGNSLTDTQKFTGSVQITGSLSVNGTTATLGTGTINTVPKFTAVNTIGNSNITDNGTLITLNTGSYVNGNLSIGTATIPFGEKLFIQGDASAASAVLTTSANSGISTLSVNVDRGLQGGVNIIADKTNQLGIIRVNNSDFWPLVFQVRGADGTLERMRITNIGSVGIGATSLGQFNLRISKNITGAATSYSTLNDGVVQSTVGTAIYNSTSASTAAASFTLNELRHFFAQQGTFGAGSTVTNQYGFLVDSSLTGATNNYGFYGAIASGTNRWNLYMAGTATNYLAGSLGIKKTAITAELDVLGNAFITGSLRATGSFEVRGNSFFTGSLIVSSSAVAASLQGSGSGVFTVDGTVGRLFSVDDSLSGSLFSVNTSAGLPVIEAFSNNTVRIGQYGQQVFYVSQSKVGIGKENALNGILDVSGSTTLTGSLSTTSTATFSGSVAIGTTVLTTSNLTVGANITGGVSAYGVVANGVIQSDVTSNGHYFISSANTAASSFTLFNLYHFRAFKNTFGASSAVTNQFGFQVDSTLTGATNNYGFYGNLAAASNVWNLYMNGTANNYLAGALGIGATALTGWSLKVGKTITGATTAYGIYQNGTVQSDVTGTAYSNYSLSQTAASAFTLGTYVHYMAEQGTFGAGSSVTNQYGFFVQSNMTGATNDFGFYGNLAAGTNIWNLYMAGTAANYMAGSLGIGSTSLTGYNFRMAKNITGATVSINAGIEGQIQSDVTSQAFGVRVGLSTAATAFSVTDLFNFRATNASLGGGSSIGIQYGFAVADLTSGGANYAFESRVSAGTNKYGLYFSGDANNYLAGNLGIGTTSLTGRSLSVTKNITGAVTSYGILSNGTIQSDVTNAVRLFNSVAVTAAASFTLSSLVHYYAEQSTIGAGSAVTNQYGFYAESNLIGATNDYGFYGNLAAASNVWNLYMNGTANNYLAGALGIGSTSLTNVNLIYNKTITGAVTSYGIFGTSIVGADVTTAARYNGTSVSTAASAFTLTELTHYYAGQGTFGAGSTVTNQYGFYAQSSIQSATNNYGFFGNIPSGANRWNLYMNGTAANYMAGNLGLGTITPATSAKLTIMGNLTFGLPGNGLNTSGRFISIEGNTDASGEGSSRIFFAEHNSSTVAMDSYGMSLGYRGGDTTIVGASGNTWNGLSLISNGEWGMWGHDNNSTGSLIMYGDRVATFINLSNNNLNNVGDAYFNGNVSIGKVTPTTKLDVNGNVLVTGSISATADITAFSTSDINFKENIQYIPNALEKLDKIGGYTFDWKSDEELVSLHNFRGHDIGVIAQEIEEVLPEVVATRDNGYKAVKYEKLTAFLIQVVKELKADNEDLRNEINNLKNK
jgi:hypothetical protein